MVAELPSWETLPHERLSPRADTVGRRLAVLRRLAHPEEDATGTPVHVVVTSVRSLIQPMLAGLGEIAPVRLRVGQVHDFDAVLARLADLAYTRVDMVDRRGEFAVRGGIIDVFPPTADHPRRVEFWAETRREKSRPGAAGRPNLDRAGRRPGHRRHRMTAAYGCCGQALTRFTGHPCTGPGRQPARQGTP